MDCVKAGYQKFTGAGTVAGAGIPVTVYAINILLDGTATTASTVSLYNDISLDATITLNGTTGKGVVLTFPNGLTFPNQCDVTLDDAHVTSVTVIYTRP